MTMNKYMHPRNIYREQPDFKYLAQRFPEFSAIVKTDVNGKASIDFKNSDSLRVLTKCLLKSDFSLDVDIPVDKLVPTLPLRLNYILWIEDLLNSITRKDNVNGLDIGTGACAVYPLLAAVKNKWHMVGTETDEESFLKAQENVERNNLNDFIKLLRIQSSSVLEEVFKSCDQSFDFCMCNPPFYSSFEELKESRNTSRPPPKNGFTGSPHELITEGGELEFCRKIISESINNKDKVLIFTTMVGHKYNLLELLQDLNSERIENTHTEFCQGRVTRWGLAWTFQRFNLNKIAPPRNKKSRKKDMTLTYIIPQIPNINYTISTSLESLINILNKLNINHKIITKRKDNVALDIIAMENTWSHQRRKRRLMKMHTADSKRMKEAVETVSSKSSVINIQEPDTELEETAETSTKTNETNINEKEEKVHAIVKLLLRNTDIILEIEYLSGTSGKDGIHQILQYIKNNWK